MIPTTVKRKEAMTMLRQMEVVRVVEEKMFRHQSRPSEGEGHSLPKCDPVEENQKMTV